MNTRSCQPCTACCDGWVKMTIQGVPVFPGHPCPHSTRQGCDDYLNRPIDPCVNFSCGWIMAASPLPDWMKPDNARVIVLFNKFQWQGVPVDLAVPVGKRIPPRALTWLRNFAEAHRPFNKSCCAGKRPAWASGPEGKGLPAQLGEGLMIRKQPEISDLPEMPWVRWPG